MNISSELYEEMMPFSLLDITVKPHLFIIFGAPLHRSGFCFQLRLPQFRRVLISIVWRLEYWFLDRLRDENISISEYHLFTTSVCHFLSTLKHNPEFGTNWDHLSWYPHVSSLVNIIFWNFCSFQLPFYNQKFWRQTDLLLIDARVYIIGCL